MEPTDILTSAGIFGGTATLIILIIGFFGKKLIEYFVGANIEIKKNELNFQLEIHKQQLEVQTKNHQSIADIEFEEFRNKLEVLKLQNQVQFGRLHEKRCEVIETLFELLFNLHNSAYSLTIPAKAIPRDTTFEKLEQSNYEEAVKAFNKFNEFYNIKSIYLQKSLCDKIMAIKESYREAVSDYSEKLVLQNMGVTGQDISYATRNALLAWENVRNEIPRALDILAEEFRRLLGVTEG